MKYRKKPVAIEAFKYDGDLTNNKGEYYIPDWAKNAFETGVIYYDTLNNKPGELFIQTLEGNHHVSVGDYIIQGVQGELYPCKPTIFEQTYELENTKGLDFGMALSALKNGDKVARKGWHKSGMYVQLQIPDINSKMTACYMYITIEGNYRIPWHPSQADMIEEDWIIEK